MPRTVVCGRTVLCFTVGLSLATVPWSAAAQGGTAPETESAAAEVELTEAEERALVPLDGEYGSEVEKRWRAILGEEGLSEGANDRDVYIVSGVATVAMEKGARGWIESRRIAHDIAYERAKAELVSALGQVVQREGSTEFLSRSSFGQGSLEREADRLDQVARIRGKLADLAEAEIDQALEEIDPGYRPETYDRMDMPELDVALETLFEQSSYRAAASVVAGATTFRVIEGPSADARNHEVLVGLVWSPRLASLAATVVDGTSSVRTEKTGVDPQTLVPELVGDAVTAMGTRVFIDDKGDRALISFAQVEPAAVSAADRSQAQRMALSTAEDLAIGQIAAFAGERIAFESETRAQQLTQVYADLVQRGVEIDTEQLQTIRTATGRVEISGAETLWQQVVQHPETQQDIAVVAVLWSPSNQAMAGAMRTRMQNPQVEAAADPAADRDDAPEAEPGMTFESDGVSSDAY